MTGDPQRVLRPGQRISLGEDVYTVIQLNGTTVTLQDEYGELSAVLLGYLLTAPGFQALGFAPPQAGTPGWPAGRAERRRAGTCALARGSSHRA